MPENTELDIPDIVVEYLEPIQGILPQGSDAANDPEYFKLTMEIPRNPPDYRNWIELSNLILKEKSKDLKVASWLLFPLYRTEGLKGLRNGLLILLQLLRKYGNDLYPLNILHKSKAIQFIATARVIKLLEKEQVNSTNAEDLKEAEKLVNEIEKECSILFSENAPVLKPLSEAVQLLIKNAAPAAKPPEKTAAANLSGNTQQPKPSASAAPKITQPQVIVSSEKDAVSQLRKIISVFFEYDEEGSKKQRVPENYFVFGVSRQLQWNMLTRPADTAGVTLIEAPNKIIQGLIKDWFSNNSMDILISRIESEFIKENSEFRYWLDAQRYLVNALEKKGGNCTNAASDIKLHLSKLLIRIPDLSQLKFKDKLTPFADSETVKWIDDEVKNSFSTNGVKDQNILPVIKSEEFEGINKEYEAVCKDSADNFEKNLTQMQSALLAEENKKGKFLRRLNLANFLLQHKEYHLSRVNLLELKEVISLYNLAEWEKALSTAVWQSLFLVNSEILQHNKDETLKQKLKSEQEELFYNIAKYDSFLALRLTKTKKWR